MLQAFLALKGVAGCYARQNLGLVDSSWLEYAPRSSRDRRRYAGTECWVQAGANRRLVLQTAFRHCQRSPLESFRWFGQTACARTESIIRPNESKIGRDWRKRE